MKLRQGLQLRNITLKSFLFVMELLLFYSSQFWSFKIVVLNRILMQI